MSVLRDWYLVIEIPQKLDAEAREPATPGERCLRLGPRVFIIARHRESLSSFLSPKMDRSGSGYLTPWRTWDNESRSPYVRMLLSRASIQTREFS